MAGRGHGPCVRVRRLGERRRREGTDVDTFGPRVVNPKVIKVGRRYSLVHRPGLYLINDTKDPNAPGELFPAGERSQALWRYRQLEARSKSARLQRAIGRTGTRVLRAGTSFRAPSRRDRRGVLERGRIVDARSRVAARRVSGPRGRTLVPIAGVVSLGILIATLLILVESLGPETADPAFSLGVGEVAAPTLAVAGVAAPTLAVGSGDPPRAELPAQVDEASPPPGAQDGTEHRQEAGRGDASAASDSDSPTGSSAGSESATVQVAVSDGSSSDASGGSGSGSDSSGSGSGDSGSVDQGGGGSSGDSGSGPGGAGPGGGSVDDGGGTGTGGGGGGGG
jgi:hypothetical protein